MLLGLGYFGVLSMSVYFVDQRLTDGRADHPFEQIYQTFFFRAIVWMAIGTVLVFMAVRRRLREDWDLIFVLSTSSLLLILAYFPTTPSTEIRYLFWPAIASGVALIFGIYLRRLR